MKTETPDLELINRIRNGDKAAFTQIVKRYEAKIASTVYGMLGKTQEADDVGQEVFIRFYKAIDKFRGDSKLSTYLTRIAINLCLNEIKKNKVRSIFSFESWSKKEEDNPTDNNNFERFEKSEIVRKALNNLDVKYRSVITLRILDGYSTEETADILGLPIGTVLSRLSRGQQKLKNILAPYKEEL